jgi:hypothetical protein
MGEVIQIPRVHARSHRPEPDCIFVLETDEALGSIARVLKGIIDGDQSCLRALSKCLLDLITKIENEPRIESAVDRVFEAARRLALANRRDQASEQYNELTSAYLHLRRHIVVAKPRGRDYGERSM